MIPLFYFFPTNNLKTDSYLLWTLYFIFIFLFFYTISFYFSKNINFHIGVSLFIQIVWFCLFFLYLYFQKNDSRSIFFESLPNDNSKIRNSIQSFIESASLKNPYILPYEKNNTYVYFSYDFQQILLKTSISRHYSQLEQDIEKILKKYPYIPLAIIKDTDLISLMSKPFLNIEKSEIESNFTTMSPLEENFS